jgi:hypothetical protein
MSRRSDSRSRRIAFFAIMVLIAIAVPLLLGELLLRLAFPQSYMVPRLVSSTTYGHALPRSTVMEEGLAGRWVFHYTVNALGYRGQVVPPGPNPTAGNVVVLGDSYSFGEGVNDGEEYPAVLDELLPEGANVINLSVPGYALTQQIRWYHDFGAAYAPAVVIIQYTGNDLWENVANPVTRVESGGFVFEDSRRHFGWLKDRLGRSILQHSQLYNLLRESAFVLVTGLEVGGNRDREEETSGDSDLEQNYLALLEPFVAQLRADGVRVLYLPVNDELNGHPILTAGLERLDREDAIELLPTESWFEGMSDFGSPEGHIWGPVAHRLIASELAKRIRPLLPQTRGES